MEEAVFYNLSQDATLGGDSPSIHKIPSQAALKAYIDAKAAASGPNYFYVEDASGAANTLTIKKNNNVFANKVFEWSLDKQNWTEITITNTTGVSIPMTANGRVYLRGNNGTLADSSNYHIVIDCQAQFKVGGDLTTLLYKTGSVPELAAYALAYLFDTRTRLISAQDVAIPCFKAGSRAFKNLFSGCSNNEYPCKMPNIKELNTSLFESMYAGNIKLKEVMQLPIALTGSGTGAFFKMYTNCKALTDGGIIPQFTLSSQCLYYTFQNCQNLARIEVYATTWDATHTTDWLQGVAATGDFYNLGGATIPTGTNGIPSGWTEHTQLP